MKLYSGLIALIFVLLSSFAYAQDAAEFKKGERPVSRRNSSQENRANKNIFLGGQVVGWGPGPNVQSGLIGGFFLNEDNQILLEATNGNRSWSGYSDSYVNSKSFGVHLKHFVGNTFYIKAGADYTEVERKYNYYFSFNNTPDGYYFKGSKVAASFVIGNQWQFDHFTLGCDWVGLSAPLSHKMDEERTYGNGTYNASDLASDRKEYLEDVTVQLVHFYLGWSF